MRTNDEVLYKLEDLRRILKDTERDWERYRAEGKHELAHGAYLFMNDLLAQTKILEWVAS